MRKIKVITLIDRFNWFSDTWIKYHLNYFHKSDLVFLYEERYISTQSLITYLKSKNFESNEINIRSLGININDQNERMEINKNTINNLVKELMVDNDVVIFLDIDELLYHDNLMELLNTFPSSYLVTNPIDVMQYHSESKYDFSKPLYPQRMYHQTGHIQNWYKKPCIIREVFEFGAGRHTLEGIDKLVNPSTGLYLIHLSKIDYDFCEELNKQNRDMYINQDNQNGMIGKQFSDWWQGQFKFFELIPIHIIEKINN